MEIIRQLITKKISEFDYKSVNFRLALVKESHFWKVITANIIFDITNARGNKTLIESSNFMLEDFSVSIEKFWQFFDYLETNKDKINMPDLLTSPDDEIWFSFGNYKLCMFGGFVENELHFQSRQNSQTGKFGLDLPNYWIGYSPHNSLKTSFHHKITLTNNDPPFSTVAEAINYFWNTDFDMYGLSGPWYIFCMPIFDASISQCKTRDAYLKLKLDINENRTLLNELSVSVIAEGENKNFNKKFETIKNPFEIPLDLIPNTAKIYLHRNGEKIDEFWYQSPNEIARVNAILENYDSKPKTNTINDKRFHENVDSQIELYSQRSDKIFIVHGHDERSKLDLSELLKKMKLEPVILHEQANKGKTIIEKFEEHAKDVNFAFVLLTPDDIGGTDNNSLEKRARQNVILELGYFIGKLGRNNVCCLYKNGTELPSDMNGIIYVKFNELPRESYPDIKKELEAAGYKPKSV